MTYINKVISFCNVNPNENICNHTQKRISQELLFSNYNQIVDESRISCEINSNDSIPCTFIANYCLLIGESTDFCNIFQGISANSSCIKYQQTSKVVFRDTIIPESFDYSSIIKIVLAVFAPTGEFIGFSPLKNEIQNCGSRYDNLWRRFGRNFYDTCKLNISQLSLNFYEPFLYIEDQDLLYQIPILPTNYIQDGQNINDEDHNNNDDNYQFFTRFFLYDNYSLKKTQYASEISFIIKIREDDHRKMHIPYLSIKYENIDNTEEILDFKFSAKYLLHNSNFSTFKTMIIIIAVMLAIAFSIFYILLNARILVSDVPNQYFVMLILSTIFESLGYAFFFISFLLGFYILCGYKWTNYLSMCLEPESKYSFVVILVFLSFFFQLLGIIFLIINQSQGTLQVIDWDDKSSICNHDFQARYMARSRQGIVANEWSKLSVIRGIDTHFIVIFVLLIIRGCKMDYLQQPIPTTDKIDAGKKYPIIEIGLTSFVWIVTSIIFWIFKRFVYWNICGNPFTNFQQLCLSLNVSVVMMVCNTRGFLINGKQTGNKSASQLTNNYDYHENSDPEKKSQDEIEDKTEKSNKSEQSNQETYDDHSDEESYQSINDNNSNNDEQDISVSSEQKIQKKEKKKSHLINSREKIIDENYSNIDNIGMENNDSDHEKKSNGKDKKGNSNEKESNDKTDDADVDVDIDIESDTNTKNKNDDDIIEEEEEPSESSEDKKLNKKDAPEIKTDKESSKVNSKNQSASDVDINVDSSSDSDKKTKNENDDDVNVEIEISESSEDKKSEHKDTEKSKSNENSVKKSSSLNGNEGNTSKKGENENEYDIIEEEEEDNESSKDKKLDSKKLNASEDKKADHKDAEKNKANKESSKVDSKNQSASDSDMFEEEEEEDEINETLFEKKQNKANHKHQPKDKSEYESSSFQFSEYIDPANKKSKPKKNLKNVILDIKYNDEIASKPLQKFTFHPVNLIEDESENGKEEESSSVSDVELISDTYSFDSLHIPRYQSETESIKSLENDADQKKINKKNETSQKRPKSQNDENKGLLDIPPTLDRLYPSYQGENEIFEIFLERGFSSFVNRNDQQIEALIACNKRRVHPGNVKSIPELIEETNETWIETLSNKENSFRYFIEESSFLQSLLKMNPKAVKSSVFTIREDSCFKDSMLYGIQSSLMMFYLVLFVSIEIIFNASISGLVVFLVDALILKLFKWRRRKYLLDRQFPVCKSLVR